jgi:hypothetical protein
MPSCHHAIMPSWQSWQRERLNERTQLRTRPGKQTGDHKRVDIKQWLHTTKHSNLCSHRLYLILHTTKHSTATYAHIDSTSYCILCIKLDMELLQYRRTRLRQTLLQTPRTHHPPCSWCYNVEKKIEQFYRFKRTVRCNKEWIEAINITEKCGNLDCKANR